MLVSSLRHVAQGENGQHFLGVFLTLQSLYIRPAISWVTPRGNPLYNFRLNIIFQSAGDSAPG